MDIKCTHHVSASDIADLIVTAVEGGSGYWCRRFCLITGTPTDTPWYASPGLYEDPNLEIGWETNDGDADIVVLSSFERAMNQFAEQYPQRFSNFITGHYDADDADVFLQLLCLGEEVYG